MTCIQWKFEQHAGMDFLTEQGRNKDHFKYLFVDALQLLGLKYCLLD